VTLKELRLRRIRHDIRAQEIADSMGTSRSWVYQLERYYQGPSLPQWRERYREALEELIDTKRQKVKASTSRAKDGDE